MTRHIKCALVAVLLISISCSGKNIIVDEIQPNESLEILTEGNQEPENFKFFRSFQFCDNPYAAFTQEEANSVYLNKKIRIDRTKKIEPVNWNSFFYEGSMPCVEEELGEKHDSSYSLFTNEDFPFDKIVVFNNKYLLVAQDGFFFVFNEDGESAIKEQTDPSSPRNSLKPIMQALEGQATIPAPVEYSYDFIMELKGFQSVDYRLDVPELDHLADFQYAKLQTIGKTNLLLVSGYMDSGQSEIYLFTLNGSYEMIDLLLLYTNHEIEDGAILTRFDIDENHRITITKEERGQGSPEILEKKLIKINQAGNFATVKKESK